MKKIFNTIFILYFFTQFCLAQSSVKKELSLEPVSSSMNKQKANLVLVKEDEREFELPDSLSQYDYFIYKNELKNHLTKLGKQDEQYWNQLPILLCYNKNKMILSLDTNYDNSFKDEELLISSNLDSTFSINFNFKHKQNSINDISIPVKLKVLFSNTFIRLSMQYDSFFSSD